MTTVKGTNQNTKDGIQLKPHLGWKTNKHQPIRPMIFQEMKRLKAQIKNKRWKPAKPQPGMENQPTNQPVRQGFFNK